MKSEATNMDSILVLTKENPLPKYDIIALEELTINVEEARKNLGAPDLNFVHGPLNLEAETIGGYKAILIQYTPETYNTVIEAIKRIRGHKESAYVYLMVAGESGDFSGMEGKTKADKLRGAGATEVVERELRENLLETVVASYRDI